MRSLRLILSSLLPLSLSARRLSRLPRPGSLSSWQKRRPIRSFVAGLLLGLRRILLALRPAAPGLGEHCSDCTCSGGLADTTEGRSGVTVLCLGKAAALTGLSLTFAKFSVFSSFFVRLPWPLLNCVVSFCGVASCSCTSSSAPVAREAGGQSCCWRFWCASCCCCCCRRSCCTSIAFSATACTLPPRRLPLGGASTESTLAAEVQSVVARVPQDETFTTLAAFTGIADSALVVETQGVSRSGFGQRRLAAAAAAAALPSSTTIVVSSSSSA
mmetsp:Transcript_24644/g.48012  ORF Transcript_24644/g.48012 Transcript_24644/m.48012 type:complete len:272 (-) Transcript_24644:43-858(-)